jgi:hypothetical protein
MSTSSYLKIPNLGNSQADQLAALTGDILYPELNLSLSNNIKTLALENDLDSAAGEPSQSLHGDSIAGFVGALDDPIHVGSLDWDESDVILVDDVPVIIVPASPQQIVPTSSSVVPRPADSGGEKPTKKAIANGENDLVTADVTARIYTIRKVLETLVEGEKAEMLTGSSQFGLI